MDIINRLNNLINSSSSIDEISLKNIKYKLKKVKNNIGYNSLKIDNLEVLFKIGYLNYIIEENNLLINIKDSLNNRSIFKIKIPLYQIKDIYSKDRSFIKITTHNYIFS